MKNPLLPALARLNPSENLLKEVELLAPETLKNMLSTIDESNHSLDEWAEALIEISSFLDQNQRMLSFERRFEYLSCCAEAQRQSGSLSSLKSILQYFLNTQGVN